MIEIGTHIYISAIKTLIILMLFSYIMDNKNININCKNYTNHNPGRVELNKAITDRSVNEVYSKLLCRFSNVNEISGKNGKRGIIGINGDRGVNGNEGNFGELPQLRINNALKCII